MLRSFINRILWAKGIDPKNTKRRVAARKLAASVKQTRTNTHSLIYGDQGQLFENNPEPKPWQHYTKPNLSGRSVDLTKRTREDGSKAYIRLRTGQLIRNRKPIVVGGAA